MANEEISKKFFSELIKLSNNLRLPPAEVDKYMMQYIDIAELTKDPDLLTRLADDLLSAILQRANQGVPDNVPDELIVEDIAKQEAANKTFEVSTNNPHSGTYSLHCVSDGNGDYVYTTVSVDTNLRYKISAYMKCVGPVGTSAKAKMKVGSAFGDSTNYESQTVGYDSYKGFDEWDYVEWIGFPSASTTYISFVESSANNANEWYVDDIRV